MRNTLFLVCGCAFLAGCGGGGSSDSSDRVDTGNAELDLLLTAAQSDFDASEAVFEAEGYTPFVEAQNQSGTVLYNGVAFVVEGRVVGSNPQMDVPEYLAIGSFTTTVDFDMAQPATGRAFDFFELTDIAIFESESAELSDLKTSGPVAGSFDFAWGMVEADSFDEAVLTGTVTGSLTKGNGSQVTLTNTPVEGFFVGNDFDSIEVSGDESSDTDFAGIAAFGFRE